MAIERAFLRTPDGLIHYRFAPGPAGARKLPLVMAHGGPGSSAGLAPLIAELGEDRMVVAPDMMGNGESDPPLSTPTIEFYAQGLLAVLDHLGLETVDLYGHHTGAQVVTEFTIANPLRASRLVLDGAALFSTEQRDEFLALYAPAIRPDPTGQHLTWVWNFLSQTTQHFPHYLTDELHRIEGGAPMPPNLLTDRVAEVLKVWSTYHLAYEAAFRHDFAARLPLLKAPTLILAVDRDPLAIYAAEAGALAPLAQVRSTKREHRGSVIRDFLNVATG